MFTTDDIPQLAPDSATLERAYRLLSPRRWSGVTHADTFIWGECRSQGVSRYRVAWDLANRRAYSNTPILRKPDKYALALAILWLRDKTLFKQGAEIPDWVREGLQPTVLSAAELATRADQQAEQRRRTREQRLAAMQDGVQELRQWLVDVARQGLGALQAQPATYWEAIAARLVDQKLAAVANRIRQLRDKCDAPDWITAFAQEIADLHLWVEAFDRLDELPEALQDDVLTYGGVRLRKDDILADGTTVKDQWLVVGRVLGEENKLRFRRVWLWGTQQNRFALLLDFAWGDAAFEGDWQPGQLYAAVLVYYPSAHPQRALFKEGVLVPAPALTLTGESTVAAFLDSAAIAIGQQPWLGVIPALLSWVTPVQSPRLLLVDQARQTLPLAMSGPAGWKLLAASGGQPVTVFGEWQEAGLTPLSLIRDGQVVSLAE